MGEADFLFFSKASDEKVERLLHEQLQLTLLDKYHMTYEQWQGGVLPQFMRVVFSLHRRGFGWIHSKMSGILFSIRELYSARGPIPRHRIAWKRLNGYVCKRSWNRLTQHRTKILKNWERSSIWHTFYGKVC